MSATTAYRWEKLSPDIGTGIVPVVTNVTNKTCILARPQGGPHRRLTLQLPPKKRGMFEQADVDWGFKKPEPPQPLGDPNPQPYGVIKVSALKYVKTLIDQEIRTAGGQP